MYNVLVVLPDGFKVTGERVEDGLGWVNERPQVLPHPTYVVRAVGAANRDHARVGGDVSK